jgi:RNA polymerase I-specific transcription initiation factor RRN3
VYQHFKTEYSPAFFFIFEMQLDSIMLLLFQHVEQRVQKDPACAPLLFQMIIPVFESTVLTTHRSKYVQFIVFYLCGCNTTTAGDLYRDFAGHLVEAVLDHYRATVTRQSAACYLASFVSRGKYVCPETACEAVAALLRWAEAYLSVVVSNNKNGNDVRSMCESHSLFYTVCQAAYYIMCFRGAEAVQFYREAVDYHARNPKKTEDSPYPDLDHIDMAPERWEKICGHRLQPLRFCLESVREEFILVAQVFNLLPPALSKNLDIEAQQQSSRPRRKGKSINTPATTMAGRRRKGGVGGLGRGSNPLDSFFPFDPYLLQRSSDYVDPLYRNWEKSIEEETDILEDQLEEDDDEELEDAIHIDSDDSADDDSDDDDDSSGEEQTHMTASVESTNFLQTMSYNSAASISSSVPKNSPSTSDYRQAQQEAWSTALKRPRAPSIAENGSW